MAVTSFGIRLTQVDVPAKLPFYRLCTMYKWSQLSGPPFPILMQGYTNYILSILRIYYVHEIGGGASMRKCIRSGHWRAWHVASAHKNHRYDGLSRNHEQGSSLFWLRYGEVKAWRVGDKEVEGWCPEAAGDLCPKRDRRKAYIEQLDWLHSPSRISRVTRNQKTLAAIQATATRK